MADLAGVLVLLVVAAAAVVALLSVVLVRGMRHPPRHTSGYAVARNLPCDPGDAGLAYEAWMLERPGGVRLPVWEIDTDSGGGGGGGGLVIVLVHGWGQSRIDMLARIDAWREHADRIVLYDLRGHGDAEGGPSALGSGEEEDLHALLERLGDGPVVVVGHSMGAVIAIAAAAEDRRGRIRGVIAIGPYVEFHGSLRGRMRVQQLPVRPLTDIAMLWLRARGLRHRSVVRDAERMRCPLLVVHGVDDRVSPSGHADRLMDAAPDAESFRVAGGGHLDAHRIDPVGHDRHVRAFLDRVRARPLSAPGS